MLRLAVWRPHSFHRTVEVRRQRILLGHQRGLVTICMEISSCTPGCPADAVACEIPLQAKLRSPCPDRIALGLFEQLSTVVQHVCLATVDPLTRRIAILDGDTKIANTITKRVDVANAFQRCQSIQDCRSLLYRSCRCNPDNTSLAHGRKPK